MTFIKGKPLAKRYSTDVPAPPSLLQGQVICCFPLTTEAEAQSHRKGDSQEKEG